MAYCGEPTRLGRDAETKSQFNKLLALAGSFLMRKKDENTNRTDDELYKKYQAYLKLDRYKIEYRLYGGKSFELEIDIKALPHLMGLHYLTDIRQLARFADKDDKHYTSKEVLRDIRNGVLNDSLIKSSIYFSKIEDRYNNFTEQNISSLLKASKVIIDFNPNVVNGSGEIGSSHTEDRI